MPVVKESQYTKILRMLQQHDRVSNFDLFKITPRYSARIHELRNDGYQIDQTRDKGNMFRKAQTNLFWFHLTDRFEISSRD